MDILMLCEGDAEVAAGSGSGTPYSVVHHLRQHGNAVASADVDLTGVPRLLAAAATFSPQRRRWAVKYHLNQLPFDLRSRNAARAAAAAPHDAVLQYGATFAPRTSAPYFLYCDSNTSMATHDDHSWAAALTPAEQREVIDRERAVYAGAAAIFTFSDRARRSFVEDFGIAPARVTTVYAGPNVDVSAIPPRPDRAPGAAPTILFVGREFARKGGDTLLAAFRTVRQALPAAQLVIIGPTALDVADPGVTMLGYLDKNSPDDRRRLLDAYAAADVFCFPTRYEPFGIVLLEAMFYGLPCVASNVWAVPEMVADGETGLLFDVNDAAALADRLLRVLRDPELARRMGAAGRARAEAEFTWPRVTRRMTDVMAAALGRG